MMPISDKELELLNRIQEKTHGHEMGWEATADENTFIAAVPEFSLSISYRKPKYENSFYYSLTISNHLGQIVAEIKASQYDENKDALQAIFEGARRVAFNADGEIEKLLTALG
ncbi:MAG: hypothetical protein GC154_16155 [bacterium]|nr:hypothetical protein [bacterium]